MCLNKYTSSSSRHDTTDPFSGKLLPASMMSRMLFFYWIGDEKRCCHFEERHHLRLSLSLSLSKESLESLAWITSVHQFREWIKQPRKWASAKNHMLQTFYSFHLIMIACIIVDSFCFIPSSSFSSFKVQVSQTPFSSFYCFLNYKWSCTGDVFESITRNCLLF
jgi:hypothetical protein